jgi:excisionase family DNA binding protein
MLKPKEVMMKLSVSRSKVYQLIRDGIIPSVNIGGCLRVPEEALNALLRQQLFERLGLKEEGLKEEGQGSIAVISGKRE